MQYASDPQVLVMIIVLPGFFGLSLVGEGVYKLMNYDKRGWIGIIVGSSFLLLILLTYLMIITKVL
ncbi:MAG: hypothetical protein ABII80_02190 [bacterium]